MFGSAARCASAPHRNIELRRTTVFRVMDVRSPCSRSYAWPQSDPYPFLVWLIHIPLMSGGKVFFSSSLSPTRFAPRCPALHFSHDTSLSTPPPPLSRSRRGREGRDENREERRAIKSVRDETPRTRAVVNPPFPSCRDEPCVRQRTYWEWRCWWYTARSSTR